MSKRAALLEKREELIKQIQQQRDTLHAQGGVWKDEQEKTWNEVNASYDATQEELRKLKVVDEVDSRLAEIDKESRKANNPNGIGRDDNSGEFIGRDKISEETRCRAFAAHFRRNLGYDVRDKDREAMRQCGYGGGAEIEFQFPGTQEWKDIREKSRNGNRMRLRENLQREFRAQSAITLATGGVLVPETLIRELNINMLTYGAVEQVAKVIVTQDGGQMIMPSVDDTTNSGRMVGENSDQSSNVTDLAFGGLTLSAYKFSSDFLKVPQELLEDNAVDLAGMIGAILGERIARGENAKFTTGTGAGQPQGIITGSSSGKTTASATAITYDELIDLQHSVDPAYRTNAGWMMHDTVLAGIRKIKDTSGGSGAGAYIFQAGADGNVPDRLNGQPIYINNNMASSIATGLKTVLYGAFEKYIIRRVRGLRLKVLVERFAESDQVGYIGFDRADGGVFSAGTMPLKYMTQA